jgi:hypothetical protein
MKILGRGWQYTTYDLENGRVRKIYNSWPVAYWVIFTDCLKFSPLKIFKTPWYHNGCKAFARDSMKRVAGGRLDSWMMGDPKILNELDYEQDFLTPLHEKISAVSLDEAKKLVDAFVEFNKVLVERSLIDKSFNITKNFGVDAQGRVVLMDLGELYADKASIDEQRRKRMWTFPYVTRAILSPEIRDYYVEQMDMHFGL